MITNGEFYKTFISRDNYYSDKDIICIENTVTRLINLNTSEQSPGMLLGKIQSGKTKTFLAILALAFDNEFSITIVLTKGTKALAKQTYERISSEFKEHERNDLVKVFDIMTMPSHLTGWELNQKIVLVVKKQKDNLNKLIELFENKYPDLRNKRILIIDDEADYASVGFKKEKGEVDINTTAHQLEQLRNIAKKTSFLQVTATPYSLYLQPETISIKDIEFRPIRPAFTELVPVHENYIGSDYYFSENIQDENLSKYLYQPVKNEELLALRKRDYRKIKIEKILTCNIVKTLRSALCNFVVGGCIRRLQAEEKSETPKKFSFLIHTDSGKATHSWQEEVVDALKNALANAAESNNPIINELISSSYNELLPSLSLKKFHIPNINDVTSKVKESLKEDWVMITKVNSERQVEELLDETGQLRLRTPLNIFIGGQILDRGITITNLIGFYYGRKPNIFQQDTVLQHSRMFGFRPLEDLAVTRFYTENTIYVAMKKMHECDVALREALHKNPDHPIVFIEKSLNGSVIPCSPNKIALSKTTTLKPYKRILPVGFQTIYKMELLPITKKIDTKLEELSLGNDLLVPFLITKNDALELIGLIEKTMIMEEGYNFDWESMKAALIYLIDLNKGQDSDKIWCLVRKDRNIKRTVSIGSHALFADAPDSTKNEGLARKKYSIDIPMLVLTRQNGLKSNEWRDCPFYWPILSAQEKIKPTIFSEQNINS